MRNPIHITNGDYLTEDLKKIPISGEIMVCREALVSGDIAANSLQDFWEIRAKYIAKAYNVSKKSYYKNGVSEFEKMLNIREGSDVNLWFEDDLFCQVNLWFCISLLSEIEGLKMFRVFPKPSADNLWKGFSDTESSELEACLGSKVLLNENDINLAQNLWKSYKNKDIESLKELSKSDSTCYRFLEEVIDAYININPVDFIRSHIENGMTDFNSVFEKFREELGSFGFGDLQVKSLYEKVLNEKL